jgi:hypothetical protein
MEHLRDTIYDVSFLLEINTKEFLLISNPICKKMRTEEQFVDVSMVEGFISDYKLNFFVVFPIND